MMALRYGDDILVIDAGLMFPEVELLGVDIVIPDITYPEAEPQPQYARSVLTHCHEDHIGAIPYILRDLNVPIYGTQFHARAGPQETRRARPARRCRAARSQRRRNVGDIGPFQVEFVHVTHSTIDCVALAIRTPLGVIIHTGDFKMDPHADR